ncbi:MAG: alcohol dehydrogenase catalytic domain-containing protein [Clostridiales bacterium]|nr:alcohol dehydrogenase catalytic domain-containing protein [Clostridiales bacterium]
MKAYRIHGPHTIKLDEMEAMPVGDNCIKLKNLMCGITSADVAVYDGRVQTKYPIIPLRQCVGFVSEVGANVNGISRGQRVVVYPQASCHACKACKDGHYVECEKPLTFGVEEDGFLSDFSVVSADDVYTIPDRITDAEAVFIEHIATALNAMSKLNVEKGDQVVIMGATVDGIILAQLAMYYQAVPIMVDMHEDMLKLAQKAGVYFTVNAVDDNVVKKILALTGGHMASACAYLTNSQLPLQSACDYTSPRGRVAVIGRNGITDLNCNVNGLLEKNIDLYTVTDCGKNYSSAINMLANHTVSVESLYDNVVSFADVPAAYESMLGDNGNNRFKTLIKI